MGETNVGLSSDLELSEMAERISMIISFIIVIWHKTL